MTPLPHNWAEHIIAARKMLERIATLAEDRRFDEAIEACGELQQIAGEVRSALWYADRELAARPRSKVQAMSVGVDAA